ncbi:MAG: phage tail protein [Clostridia bacterium]|nr:phage tail protein [Clostridia bacterium]
MIPILYDKDETAFTSNGIGILSDTTFCNVTEERNGIYEITFSYPIECALFEHIQEGCFVKAKANETSKAQIFHIYKSSKPINGIVTYYGEHISYELTGNPVEKVVITNATGAQGLNKVLEAALVPHSYSGLSDIASRKSTALSLLSVRAALGGVEGSLLDVYGGEYEFDNFTIKLHESRGSDTGIIIGYGKNLTDLQQEKNISETYTALFPYAKYTPEKEEGDEEDPEEVVVTLSEKIIYSSNATRPKVLTMDFTDKFSDDEEITEAALRQKAKAWAADSGYNKPSVSIKVAFTHLWQSPEYKQYAILERVSLCDTLTVNFEKLGVSAKAKVIKTVYDTLKEKYVSIELGDAKSNFADSINQTTHEIENIKTEVKKNETATAKKIAAAVANATALITGQNGGYVVLNPSNNPQEILIMDAPSINEAVKIWRWNSGGLGYSSNGYNGPFATAITQDGAIVADFITAGEINGALIKADTVSSSAISQTFKNEITKEISDNITEVTATITQLFEAADGRLKSEIEAHITETTQTLQTSIDQNAQKITLTATEIRDEVNSIKEGLETEIRQTADSITLTASELTMLSTEMYERTDSLREDLAAAEGEISTNAAAILDANTKIQQNANAITLTANDIRGELVEVEDGLQEQISANQADIEVNADNIKMRVAKSVEYSTATRDSAVPTYSNTTAAEKKKLYFCTSNEKYYYYNEISRAWVEVDDQCVYSAFIQTANGFKLSGIVEIDGDLITKGTISADRISTNIAQVNGNLNIGNSDDDVEKELRFSGAAVIKTFFDGISPPTGIKISASKIDLEAYKLDLSDCGEIIWGSNKPVAIFG